MVGAGSIKKKFSNAGKFALAFSIFSAQLLPIHQAAHATGEISSTYKIPKADAPTGGTVGRPWLKTKVSFKVNAGEPLILTWRAFLNPETMLGVQKDRLADELCELMSSDEEAVNYVTSSTNGARYYQGNNDVYFSPLSTAYLVVNSRVSTDLVLGCRFHSEFSEGSLKISKYILSNNGTSILPKNGSIDIKADERNFLMFQAKAGKQLTFKMDSANVSGCSLSSVSERANWNNNFFRWDDGSRPDLSGFGGKDLRGNKVPTALKLFTPTANGTYLMNCAMYDGQSGAIRIQTDEALTLLSPQSLETKTTSPAKCLPAKAPSKAPKISVNPNGLWIEYTEPGLSDLPGCIDGFRVYAQTLNPYTKKVVQQNGTYSIRIADCEKRDKGLITCLIPNRETWLQTLNSQDESSTVLAVNAVAVNSRGESEASPYALLFEKESPLISAACISMQKTFSFTTIAKTPIAFILVSTAVYSATHIATKSRGDRVVSLIIERALKTIVAASIAKEVSGRVFAAIDKNAAKKFVETYPVTALELLISMKNSLNPDVRAKSKSIEKAILNSDLMKIYQPLIGKNNSLTGVEVVKILDDETLSTMKEQEIEKFERNGAQEVKSLVKKNSNVKLAVLTSVSTASLALDGYLEVIEANQNNQSAVELVLPNNCNF